jgi:CRISPR-associated protein Csb2
LALAFTDVLHKAGNPDTLRDALVWLCEQGAPVIVIPAPEHIDTQKMDGFFVPQNPSEAEGLKHSLRSRSFPTVFLDPDEPTVFFHWPDASPSEQQNVALRDLASRLPRFGHSSSLVIASVTEEEPPSGHAWRRLSPDSGSFSTASLRLRVPFARLLELAEESYDANGRAQEMEELIHKASKGANPDKKTLKPAASPRGRHDPRHLWQGYVETLPPGIATTPWDHRVLLLARMEGPKPGLSSTWQILDLFHKAILDRWSRDPSRGPVPSWISGHRPGQGSTAPALQNHLALFPLADVKHSHAQGRMMGIGCALPRPETADLDAVHQRIDWQKAMAALFPNAEVLTLANSSGDTKLVLAPANPTESRVAFDPPRWVGPASKWASVTPVVLDRHPKPHFSKDPAAWQESASSILKEACLRIGLPAPARIEVSPYSPISGVPSSAAFEPPPARPGRPPRVHFHVTIAFDQPVCGPILLGAGRFRGYGLLAPL